MQAPHGKTLRIIISGGGTGGHVFPAIAIADALRIRKPGVQILFVGAKGKLEMEKVPAAGYPIEGLWISGFQRSLSLRNLLFPVKLLHSLWRSWRIIRSFRPDVVVGVGGYASGPLLEMATRLGVPAVIQEQNSFAGVTNRLLGRKVQRVCVAFEGMERFFPADKIVVTGNPVRKRLRAGAEGLREEALAHFGLDKSCKTLLLFGGSMGARTLNQAMEASREVLAMREDVQVIWQMGKMYSEVYGQSDTARLPRVHALEFIDRMDLAYAAADLVLCRSGALTIAELALLGKPAVLVPSPVVTADHQTKNAMALVERGAARLIADADAVANLLPEALRLLDDVAGLAALREGLKAFAKPEAADRIADLIVELAEKRKA